MEDFIVYNRPLENGSPGINDSSWSSPLKQSSVEPSPSVLESSKLFIRCDISNESSSVEFYGFNSPPLTKLNLLLNFMKEIESGKKDVCFEEKDVIDGVEFLSFSNEQELMEYSKRQLEQRATASQSDDGLEMLDDGTFSDISSNHAIIPTKTKDITRIKGWRNKHFAGIHLCDDSGSSLRNEDDGFGDDFEIKSDQCESSDDVESVDLQGSTTSKFDVESLSRSTFDNEPFDVSGLDDTNAVDNTEENGFNFRKSNRATSSESFSAYHKTQNSNKSKSLDLSFNNRFNNNKCNFIPEKNSYSEQMMSKKSSDPFLSPMAVLKSPQDKRFKLSGSENKVVYKPRVKLSLIESISRKLSSGMSNIVKEKDASSNSPSTVPAEQGIRWRVPKEKLLLGNIYDVEVSLDCGENTETKSENNSDITNEKQSIFGHSLDDDDINTQTVHETDDKTLNNSENKSSISAFQSTTLDHYTTNLDELHIDFTIPKLDAADAVTHEEIILPEPTNMPSSLHRAKIKPECKIKAKTVAEKRRLLAAMNRRTRLKQKLSNTLKASIETINKYNVRAKQSQLYRTKGKNSKTGKEPKKNIERVKQLFDERGVIKCGRELPLEKRISKRILTTHTHSLIQSNQAQRNTLEQSKVGMVVNVGFKRPLYQEVLDNISSVLGETLQITEEGAAFAVSAVQPSVKGPFIVTRFLVPVVNEKLKEFMHRCKCEEEDMARIASTEKVKRQKIKVSQTVQNVKILEKKKLSEKTNQFVKINDIEPVVADITSEMLNYVERKEYLEGLACNYDPDIPETIEKENSELFILKQNEKENRKKKKTALQRQIEILGGTFIAVQGEEGNEENLLENPEDKACLKDSCVMGCVCCIKSLKHEHCGKASCMFSCQCTIASQKQSCEIKSKIWLLPEVLRLQSTSQSKLAPVEREYHQTVIMSKDKKTITIESKHKKRERKIPSKFKDEILLDYSKTDFDDIAETNIIQDKKYPGQSSKIPEEKFNDLKLPKCISRKDLKFMKQCHVKLYRHKHIDRHVSLIPFTPGLFFKKDIKSKSRNVATKKTAGTSSHMFDVESHCTRTQGVSSYFVRRNLMCKLRTKDLILYSSKPHGLDVNDAFHNTNVNCALVKEDLQLDVGGSDENESDWLERIPIEKESGPAIDFICSLPPEIFEKQDSTDLEISCANSQEVGSERLKKKTERIVYASLPTTETECRWWVVEMDSKKFSNLIYYADKRCLYFDDMMRATFKAEFGKKTVWIPLNKSHNIHRDKFGAYAVPGHKYLMFFGPYERKEDHGLTAIKMVNNDSTFCRVLFSSKFSSSEGFKSLGITMSEEESPKSAKCVKAVWWYSTDKKSTAIQDKIQHTVESTRNTPSSSEPPGLSHASTERSQEIPRNPSKEDLCDTTETLNENTTIQYDDSQTIKTELIKDEIIILDDVTAEEATINDIFVHESADVPFEIPSIFEESDSVSKTLIIDKTNTADVEARPSTPVIEENVTSDTSINSQPKPANCKKRLLLANNKPKRAKKKFTTKRKPYRPNLKTTPFKHSNNILRLQEKIAVLNAAIGMENGKPNNIRDTMNLTVDSDSSSSFSDDDFYKEIDAEGNIPPERSDNINVNRIVHLPTKILKSSDEEKKQGSLNNLMQKTPSTEPCPERALLCLTPGVGYLPVIEFGLKKLVIQDPANPSIEHQFQDHKQASLWLNDCFKKMFTFNENFDMEWSLVKGTLIRYLMPLSRSLFTFTPKELEITPMGLEPPLVMRQELRNQLERERRTEVNRLVNNLAQEVLPPDSKAHVQIVLKSANHMIKVQSIINKELDKEYEDLMKQQSHLNLQLQKIFAVSSGMEKAKELKIRALLKNAKNKPFKENMSEVYMKAMRDLEFNMVRSLEGFTKQREFNSQPNSLKNTETEADINCQIPSSEQSIEHPLQSRSAKAFKKRRKKKRQTYSKLSEKGKARPTEGMLIKRKKIVNKRMLLAGTSNVKEAESSSNTGITCDVIDLIDSDEDKNQVIEIDSEEEDVVWIPDQEPETDQTVDQDDVQIVASQEVIPRKRPRLCFPRRKPTCSIKPVRTPGFINLSDFAQKACSPGPSGEQDFSGTISLSDVEDYSDDDRLAANEVYGRAWLQEPEFVPVPDAYQPVSTATLPEEAEDYTPFISGCSRTDPVRMNSSWCRPSSSTAVLPTPTPVARQVVPQTSVVTCKSVTPIGKLPLKRAVLNKFKGKRIMLYRSDSGFKMAKLPVSGLSSYRSVPQGTSVLRAVAGRSTDVETITTNQNQSVGTVEPGPSLLSDNHMSTVGTVEPGPSLLSENHNSTMGTVDSCPKRISPSVERLLPTVVSLTRVSSSVECLLPTMVSQTPVSPSVERLLPTVVSPTPVSPSVERLVPATVVSPTPVSPNLANTVTLYHPSEEMSETRTVRFSPMNSVNIEPPGFSGPKIRRPKTFAPLRVILPKRN